MEISKKDIERIFDIAKIIFGYTRDKALVNQFIGKKCIVRAYSAGVFFGTLESVSRDVVIISEAIRLWHWEGACSLSQLAEDGTKNPGGCKFSIPVKSQMILGVIEILEASELAIKSIKEVPSWRK